MTDLPVTGPPMLDLRWGQSLDEQSDERREREFFPKTRHQEADGYLHPGVAAAAVIGAAEKTFGLREPLGSVAISFEAPVPLGMDLIAVVTPDRGALAVDIDLLERIDIEDQVIRTLVHGTFGTDRDHEVPDAGAYRAAVDAPVPEAVEHELYPRCFVCGQDNTQGLGLLPGWQAPDTAVSAFVPSEPMIEDGRVPPAMVATLLSCPTLWACKGQLDDLGSPAALLATYEVRFLETVTAGTALRTVGIAGQPEGRVLHAGSALVAEDGRIHAVATASWYALDEVPARDPGRPDPASAYSPLKGGRPEAHSSPDWGRPLPGRRETAGPRSERPGDHDRRSAMGQPVERDDPSEPRRSISDDER